MKEFLGQFWQGLTNCSPQYYFRKTPQKNIFANLNYDFAVQSMNNLTIS